MAKDAMSELNKVYTEILGAGPEIQDDSSGSGARRDVDGAYVDEDYSDDAGDGKDPREDDLNEEDEDLVGDTGSDDDNDDIEDDGVEKDDDDGYEAIPDRLVQAGRQANLSDDAIVELSESRPEVLEALARAQEAAVQRTQQANQSHKAQEDKDSTQNRGDGFEPIKLEFTDDDEDEMGPRAMKLIKTLADQVNKLGGQVNEQNNSLNSVQQQTENERIRQIDSYFDKLSDEIPDLGKTGSLTERQKQSRVFAFKTARNAMESFGIRDDEEALAMGAKALKGQKSDAQVKRRLIEDLDKNKKRFTARGHSRKRPDSKMTVEQRAMAAINRVLDGTSE